MIRGYRKTLTALVMIAILTVPVMAEEALTQEERAAVMASDTAVTLSEAAATNDTSGSTGEISGDTVSETSPDTEGADQKTAGEAAAPTDENSTEEGVASEEIEGAADPEDEAGATKKQDAESAQVNYVFKGGPAFKIESGVPVYTTHGRYELVSITADRDSGEYEKGSEIPEESVREDLFEPGTTVTYTFIRAEGEDTHDFSDISAEAEYDGVWDNETGSIT